MGITRVTAKYLMDWILSKQMYTGDEKSVTYDNF